MRRPNCRPTPTCRRARKSSADLAIFCSDPARIRSRVSSSSPLNGARGHLVMIADPVEETFPFTGHTEFRRRRFLGPFALRAALRASAATICAPRRAPRGDPQAAHRTRLDTSRCTGRTGRLRRHCWPCGCGLRPASRRGLRGPLMFGCRWLSPSPSVLLALAGAACSLLSVARDAAQAATRRRSRRCGSFSICSHSEETPARHALVAVACCASLMAAAIILAMAGPVLNPLPAGGGGKGPLLVLIDDGWPAAPHWDDAAGCGVATDRGCRP